MARGVARALNGAARLAAGGVLLLAAGTGCADVFGGGGGHDWLAWAVPVESGYHGRPGVDGGRVFIEGDSGVAAFDQRTGERLWEPRLRDGGFSTNLVHRGGRVFAAEAEVVRAYDAATGGVLWRMTPPGSGDLAESAADAGAVYVGTRTHRILALAQGDGTVLWDVDVGTGWAHAGVVSGVSVSGDTVYAAVWRYLGANGFESATVVVALDRASGRELWRFQTDGVGSFPAGAPVVAGRLLLVSDAYSNAVFAVDRFTGLQAWRAAGEAGFGGPKSSPVVAGATAYVGSGDTYVYALEVATGRVLWKTRTAASIFDVGVCGERIVVNNNDLEVVDRRTGKHLGVAFLSDDQEFATSGVAVANGRAFIAGSKKLYAVRCD
jgi:outer membrane protein assembly factor BamB